MNNTIFLIVLFKIKDLKWFNGRAGGWLVSERSDDPAMSDRCFTSFSRQPPRRAMK